MPRPIRVHVEGALYYVTARGAETHPLFRDARDYDTYLEWLKAYQEKYGFKLFAFTLLPGSVHLCVELRGATTISTIMHALHSRYTKHVISRYGGTAHVFQERFRSTLIEKTPWLLRVTAFLHELAKRSGGEVRTSYARYAHPELAAAGPAMTKELAEISQALEQCAPGMAYAQYAETAAGSWQETGRALEHRVVGSEAFIALVEQQSRVAVQPEVFAEMISPVTAQAQEPPAQPPAPRAAHRRPVGFTVSVAMASVALCAAFLSLRTIAFLKHTVAILAEENAQTFAALIEDHGNGSGVRLAEMTAAVPLSGTAWEVQLKPMFASGQMQTNRDVLQFDAARMVSTQLSAAGFPASRYVAGPPHGDGSTWEAVQMGPGGEMVTWRGQVRGDKMLGVMTREQPGSPVQGFRFVGIATQGHKTATSEI